ncbi:MAG TPA: peptidylprolyl isomerase [Bacteroidales bacterium]|nr:peptidylprolyl isomerase [Bacteroidales bacterium]
MEAAQLWDMVRIHYTGYRPDNTIFESTTSGEPLEFQLGGEVLIQGLEEALFGMKPGETKRVEIPPHLAYGEVDKDLIFPVSRKEVFGSLEVKTGQIIELPNEEVGVLALKVVDIRGDKVFLDGNHELAGQTLTFDVELVEILPDPASHTELPELE